MNELKRMYQEFNAQFWKGRLPDYRVTYYQLPPGTRGQCSSKRRLIRISRTLPSSQLRRVLLHEMCHIGCPYHGKKFLERLDRLFKMGEKWAEEEIKLYRDSETYNAAVSDMGYNLSLAMMDEHVPTYREAVQHFSAEFALTPTEFKRRFPWFRSHYRKAAQEAIKSRKIEAAWRARSESDQSPAAAGDAGRA
jgi:hypothetical protein